MDRLTIRNSDGSVSQSTEFCWADALDKLAAYEDIAACPELIEDMAYVRKAYQKLCNDIGIERMRELATADKKGCLILLPQPAEGGEHGADG